MVDLGSNTFRLVVFHYRPGGPFHLRDEIREVVRLTAGVGMTSGRLHREAVARAVRTARLYSDFCRATGLHDVDAVATSAVRDAANQDEVLAALGGAGGLPVRVLTAHEEARYGYLGAINSTTLGDGSIVDVGGGSLQVSRVVGRRLEEAVSAPLGAVRMTEAFLATPRASRGQVKALRRHVAEQLERAPWVAGVGGRMVGLGGTVRTLAAMAQKRAEYPLDEVHGYVLTRASLDGLIDQLAMLPASERAKVPGLKADRADIMLAGAVVWDAVLELAGVERVEVCAQGLREGVFYERFLEGAEVPMFADVRRTTVLNQAANFGCDLPHSEQVATLALSLFDGLARLGLHEGSFLERELLWAAAMLHDAGVLVDYNDHHKHSYYLILNAGLPGFSHRELALVALLTRAHRKGPVSLEGLGPVLEPDDEARLTRMAACLRLAEQFERGRAQLVRDLECTVSDGHVRIAVTSDGDPSLAVWWAGQQSPLFERGFGKRLEVAPAG